MIRFLPALLLIALPLPTGTLDAAIDPHAARFGFCRAERRTDCVVDGDTFWLGGQKIRIADIDTPETHAPRCDAERAMGVRATERLRVLLNAGAFSLDRVERDKDRYGRSLRLIRRDGRSIGALLVEEGLARPWNGSRQPWCRS